jgi:hypothetical protein
MPKKRKHDSDCYTVICTHHSGVDACDSWQWVTVVIKGVLDAQDAANNACLYLIWKKQGQAEAMLVIEGKPKLLDVDGGIFDAEEYDETITFGGTIVSVRE